LLEATIACVVEIGYAATSVSAIEERSAVSRGRRIHYFERKEDLMLAAVDFLFERRMQELLSQGPLDVEDPSERINQTLARLWDYWKGDFSTVVLELRTAARTDPALRSALKAHEVRIAEVTFEVFSSLLGPENARHPDCGRVMILISQAMNGLAQRQVQGVDDDGAAERVIGDWQHLVRRLLRA
jgi:AcrR family transcriptional regulator